jgi:hypothetical protein
VFRWLFSWEEAARQPRKTVIAMSVQGFVAGGLIGYFFGSGVGYGIALGLGVALIVGTFTWKTARDPARVAELTQRQADLRAGSKRALGGAAIRLALPFAALGIAAVAGAATDSPSVFVVTLAAGLGASLVLRRYLPS